jgi:hypothetical protein
LKDAIMENNIMNAKGQIVTDLFVDPANGNFQLKPTAASAIDKGLDFTPFNEPLSGPPDIGAYEYGKSTWVAGPNSLFAPVISPNGGMFIGSVEVSLQTSIFHGIIHYTLDGSDPTFTSKEYTEPFTVADTTIVKARCYISENEYTEVAAANFYVEKVDLPLRVPENPIDIQTGINYEFYQWQEGQVTDLLPDLATWTPVEHGVSDFIDLAAYGGDYFALRFTGYIEVPADGIYTFYTKSDDNSKLYIGNTLVVNNDFMQPPTERSGRIGLKAGIHAITVEFLEAGGGEALSVSYKGPTISKRYVPAKVLWHKEYIPKPAKVLFTPDGGKFSESIAVKISCSTPGARIFYTTDGLMPTKESNLFTQDTMVLSSTLFKAVAYKPEMAGPYSDPDSAYFVQSIAPVTIQPNGGVFVDSVMVTLSSATQGARIVYTLDGSVPSINAARYLEPIRIDASRQLKTMAFKDGFDQSDVYSASFSIKVSPVRMDPPGDAFTDSVTVSMDCKTPGATIYFTSNGTAPTAASTLYTKPLAFYSDVILKAVSMKNGLTPGTVTTRRFKKSTSVQGIHNSHVALSIFPNPSDGKGFTIRLADGMENRKVMLQVTNNLGEIVYREPVISGADGMVQFSKPLKTGAYNLTILWNGLRSSVKLIVE